MNAFSFSSKGFITHWLVAGPVLKPYTPPALKKTWEDQLGYEACLRETFYDGSTFAPPETVWPGQPSILGASWEYVRQGNWFVDLSSFFSTLTDIRLDAVTELNCDAPKTICATLWTYAAVDLWLNGTLTVRIKKPVYKPISHQAFEMNLKAGVNRLYLQLRNIGIRDTRNIAGIQLNDTAGITGILPGLNAQSPIVIADQWLASLTCENGMLLMKSAAPCDVRAEFEGHAIRLHKAGMVPLHGAEAVCVHASVQGRTLTRHFELMENIRPLHMETKGQDPAFRFCAAISKVPYQQRGGGITFSVFHVLARYALGLNTLDDRGLLMRDLENVERRVDCSDFLVVGLIRLISHYSMDDSFMERFREVMTGYRYWMDEEGIDGMCFWSENHALMFHGAQMVMGKLYPDELFSRSGRLGSEQYEIGAARCSAWLDDVLADGLEEFNSATYLPVTAIALLNLIDFGPEDISKKAAQALDMLLRQMCLHVFDHSIISPQGRVYREAIYPHRQSSQALLHFIFPEYPYSTTENMWSVCFVTSSYRFPGGLKDLIGKDAHISYTSGNARIRLEKTADYALTSVDCPRDLCDAPDYINLCFVPGVEQNTNAYVKSLNERFHGTTVFEPGVFGYQQHLWYAALSSECVVFTSLPGVESDRPGMRPGYWYGNGVFPAIRQRENVLGCVYEIPEDYPVSFTHLYWPAVKFDDTYQKGNWLFGRLKTGAIALWCSGSLEKWDDILTGCEYRCFDAKAAYVCVCVSYGSGEAYNLFMADCMENIPLFSKEQDTLFIREGFVIRYEKRENRTQII